jgi:foldase protein PrsA
MSESTPTGIVQADTVQADTVLEDTAEQTFGKRAKAALIVGGTAILFVVGAVAFQFLRPKVGAAQENAPAEQTGRVNMRTNAARPALARVNGELIGYDSVADECMQRYGQEVLESFINRTVIDQACRKQGIAITQAEVNEEIVKIAKKFDIDPQNWLRIIQSERHLSALQYKEDIIWPMLALKRLAGSEVKITEEEMQRVFVREYGERVKARMIMCDKLQRAQDAWNLVMKDPASFGKVARERSIEPTSKALDGQIQPIRRFAGNDNLEKEAFKLEEGHISGIIDVSTPEARRYVILLCEGHTTPIVKSKNEPMIREQVHKVLEDEKTQLAVAKVFERLKKDAQVDNFLTNTSTKGIQPTSATSSGNGRNRVTNAGYRTRAGQAPATRSAANTDGE